MTNEHLRPQYIDNKGIVVTYGSSGDAVKARAILDAALLNVAKQTEIKHFPWRSCTGCNDPLCTYDAQDGSWAARFSVDLTD